MVCHELEPVAAVSRSYINIIWGLVGLAGVILFSLMIEAALSRKSKWLRIGLQSLNIAFFLLSCSVLAGAIFYYALPGLAAVIYVLCALAYRLCGRTANGEAGQPCCEAVPQA